MTRPWMASGWRRGVTSGRRVRSARASGGPNLAGGTPWARWAATGANTSRPGKGAVPGRVWAAWAWGEGARRGVVEVDGVGAAWRESVVGGIVGGVGVVMRIRLLLSTE